MELKLAQVEAVKSIILPDDEEILLMPLGDIQLDPQVRHRPRTVDLKRLRRTIKWGVEHNAYWIGMGDYVDVASPSNREAIESAHTYDNVKAVMEEAAFRAQDELHELLEPTRGRWLGVLEGHHFWPYESGDTTDTKLADYLGCPFLGTCALLTVRFPQRGHKRVPSFKVWAHHGRGGGQLLGASLHKLEQVMKGTDADIYLMGHTHKAMAAKYPLLGSVGGERGGEPILVHRDRILGATGSYLKSYQQGSRSAGRAQGLYPEQGMMTPVALGGLVIFIRPRYDNGYASVDMDYMSI